MKADVTLSERRALLEETLSLTGAKYQQRSA